MKKEIAVLLTGVMVTSLTACGGSSESSTTAAAKTETTVAAKAEASAEPSGTGENKELVMAWWGNQVRNERTQAILDLYAEKNPGVTFDGQFSEWNDYWNKLATGAAGHSLPDIVQMDYKYLNQYVSNDLLVDLTPYIESGVLDVSNCNEGVLNAGKVGDGIYAICNGINAPGLLYNKTITDEAGVTVKDNMTFEEFKDICRQVYEKTGYKTNICYYQEDIFCIYMLRAKDIVMYGDKQLGGTAEDYISYLKIYEDGIKEGWMVDPSVFAERTIGNVEQDPLVYGSSPETRSWCCFQYTNQLTAMRNAAPEGTEINVTTWPSPDPKKSDYLKPSQFFSVTKDSANPEEAAKVIDFITNSVECNEILAGERGIPISSVVSEAISKDMDDTNKEIVAFINNVVSPNSSTINPPSPDNASEVCSLLNKMEEKVCYGQLTAEEAGTQFFEQANAILAK